MVWIRISRHVFGCCEPGSTEVRTPPFFYKTQGDSDWFREAIYELDVALVRLTGQG
jgi:hypothetical protein